jgi:transposase-like protein
MTYSYDLRLQAVRQVKNGVSIVEASKIFGIHRQTLQGWVRELHRNGHVKSAGKPGPKGGRKVTADKLKGALSKRTDARLSELGKILNVHPSTISYACKKYGITRKKNVGI